MLPCHLPCFRHRQTGDHYIYLAAGVFIQPDGYQEPVNICCPDDNEHSIYVFPTESFDTLFDPAVN